MPRSQRIPSPTAIYHVMLRGINRQDIFLDDEDFARAVERIGQSKSGITKTYWAEEASNTIIEGRYHLYGYCLMTNHIHLLIKSIASSANSDEAPGDTNDLSVAIKRIAGSYAQAFNDKYHRVGSLFQDRFRSEPVTNDAYFLTVLRYIHQNPVKAGIVDKADEYEWSSYRDYRYRSGITNHGFALGMLEGDFESFMNIENDDNCLDMDEVHKVTDLELSERIFCELKIPAPHISSLPDPRQTEHLRAALAIPGCTTRQLARVTGVQVNKIWQLNR